MPRVESAGSGLELSDLSCSYGRSTDTAFAVDNISLAVAAGEFVSFLGPSGSGKTTTLNMVAGFVRPSAGEILFDGVPMSHIPAHKRDIGMVFQHYALFPHMTVAANVAFPLRQRKTPKAETARLVAGALERVGLADFAERRPRELSGGQQQRVAVARAIVFGPRLLLMDEPLGALDKKLRESLQLEIRRIHRELGITFVYVTHDQDEALVLSDRIAVFNHGRIEQVGTPTELYNAPSTRFVADFLGESNILPGRVEKVGNAARVETSAGHLAVTLNGGQVPHDAALIVRPERVRLLAVNEAPVPEENTLSGVVADLLYTGTTRRVDVMLESGDRFLVRQLSTSDVQPAVGDRVGLAWRVEDGLLVEA